tara:strand:+ start:727 stop:897 length:171 start_codon:yes stop_codon:yes gene_type:complete
MRDVKKIPPEEFRDLFFEAVEDFYNEWIDATGASMPMFEAALEHAKEKGVIPNVSN